MKQIADGRAQARKSLAWNDYQQLLHVGGFAEKIHSQMCKAFDSATDALTKGIAHIEQQLFPPLTGAATSPFAREIRVMVKAFWSAQNLAQHQ